MFMRGVYTPKLVTYSIRRAFAPAFKHRPCPFQPIYATSRRSHRLQLPGAAAAAARGVVAVGGVAIPALADGRAGRNAPADAGVGANAGRRRARTLQPAAKASAA